MKKLLTHTILGYQFWTIFQALAPMIWFYPLNELEISGYEVFAVVVFSPLVLSLSPLENIFTCKYIGAIIRIFSTLGLLSFHASSTLQRLVALMVGVFFQMLSFALSLHYKEKKETITGTSIGLLLFVASRVWLRSFVPAWWDCHSNVIVFTICMIATLDAIYDSFTSAPPPPSSSSPPPPTPPQPPQRSTNWVIVSFCFGSLLYTTHALYGEASVLTRWTVQGFPHTGPMPFPMGALVLVFLCVGLYSSNCTHLVDSRLWWCIGGSSFLLVYWLRTWQAFTAGCVLAMFVASIWPHLLTSLSKHPAYKVLPLSMLVWLLEILFSVWTVAYNFVPGGVYTREKTGALIAAVILCFLLYALLKREEAVQLPKVLKGQFNKLLLLVLLLGLAGYAYRLPAQPLGTQVTPGESRRTITCAIWTFHFGYDNQGWPSMVRAADMLRVLDADVITLLESDASKPFLGNNDLATWLSEELDMFVDFGPSTSSHTWGNLLLSKYPIIQSTHHLLPSPHGELAPAISATVDMGDGLVDLVVTHMGNDRDNLDRRLQAETLTNLLKNSANPAVFLGYVTSEPYSRDYRKLTTVAKDIDPSDHERWCQYIMYKNLTRLAYARISHGGLSDTEVQAARFLVGSQHDNPLSTTKPDKVPQNLRFPSAFGAYRRGHHSSSSHKYHMGTPKYFLAKEN